MRETPAQTVFAYEGPATKFSLLAFDERFDRAQSYVANHDDIQSWIGDVFYDHLRGLIDTSPEVLCETCPFILVCRWEDFDWAGVGHTKVTPFTDTRALIECATKELADALAAGVGNYQLDEVYGVRVRIHKRAC